MSKENKDEQYVIVKDLEFSDYFKTESGKLKIFNTLREACEVCGMYELDKALVLKVVYTHIEEW